MKFRETKAPPVEAHFPQSFVVFLVIVGAVLCAAFCFGTGIIGLITGAY